MTTTIVYEILPAPRTLSVWVRGKLLYEQMIEHFNSLLEDHRYYPGLTSFYDLTQCTDIDGDFNDLHRFSHMLKHEHVVASPCRTSILIPENNEKLRKIVQGLILMISRPNIEHHYFPQSAREKAFQFVGFNAATISKIESLSLSLQHSGERHGKPSDYL